MFGDDTTDKLDNNTAFYEGAENSYLIFPPSGFVLNTDDAKLDGYSCAFIPDSNTYDNADILITVNYFKVESDKFKFSNFIKEDTLNLRHHYGKSLEIQRIKPLLTETNNYVETYYLNDQSAFIPDVMIGYLYNKTEILIFTLSISDNFPRFEAENYLVDCIEKIKILSIGEIEL